MRRILSSDWFTKPRCSNFIGLTSLDRSQKSVFSIFYRLSGIIFTWKLYHKISLIFLNPMIVFVCGNRRENKNGSTFSFSKIGNLCIKLGVSDLHLVKLAPNYIFQIYPKSNFTFSKYIQNICLPKSHVFNFGNNDG